MDYELRHVRGGRVAVHVVLTGRTHLLPDGAHRLLSFCERFRSLEEHGARLAARLSLSDAAGLEVLNALRRLAQEGLLLSEETARAALAYGAGPTSGAVAGGIELVGIPTGGRPLLLRRVLRSYVASANRHRRALCFIVMDDSKTPAARTANRAVVQSIRPGLCRVLYVGPAERRKLARELERRTGVDGGLLRFAFLPDARFSNTLGAARNVLLALTAGRRSLHLDDDTVARTSPAPEPGSAAALAFSSSPHPTRVHFAPWRDLRSRAEEDLSWLESHERLLGRPVSDCLNDASFQRLDLDGIGASMLRTLRSGPCAVRVTSLGSLGDAEGSTAALHFLEPEACRDVYQAGGPAYRTAFIDHRFLRVAPAYTIGDRGPCIGMNLGLDGAQPLPPFFPMQRGSDDVFGALLQVEGALFGFPPRALLHLRSVGRPKGPRLPYASTAAHVRRLIEATGRGDPGGHKALGQRLEEIALEADFEARVLDLGRQSAAARLRFLERRIRQVDDLPAYARDLKDLSERIEFGLTLPRLVVTDLAEHRDPPERLRELVKSFGRLLQHWPHVITEASRLDLLDIARR